jgi:hypothetical protein
VLRLSEHPPEERCQTLAAAAFFGELAEVEGFPAWYETLKATLTDLKVYRCGAAHLTVSVVGRDAHVVAVSPQRDLHLREQGG